MAEGRSVVEEEEDVEERAVCECGCDWEDLSGGGRGLRVAAEAEKCANPCRTGRWRSIMGRE